MMFFFLNLTYSLEDTTLNQVPLLEVMKKDIIKGFGHRVRSLCDKDTLQDELQKLEEIFMEDGYEKEQIKGYLFEKQPRIEKEENEDKLDR